MTRSGSESIRGREENMRIYTRTGDDGTTGLFGGVRTTKADPRVETCGALDEANAAIGLARATTLPRDLDEVLEHTQEDLFALGAELSCAPGTEHKLPSLRVGDSEIKRLERAIDEAETALPALRTFILPGGTPSAAMLHVARCVVRRAERTLVASAPSIRPRAEVLSYVNRLSDLLFVLARRANGVAGVPDVPWHPARS